MRRYLLIGLSLGAAFSCNPPERDFNRPGNVGGDGSTGDSGDGDESGDGDGDRSTATGDGDSTSGDGDGDSSTATGDGDGDTTSGDGDGDGGCAEACVSPLTCVAGACTLVCEEDEVICDGACVDPATDDEYCGARGECAGDDAGDVCASGYACQDGTCRLQCPDTQLACDDECINPATDDEYCGASGDCLDERAGQVCDGASKCIDGSCIQPDGAECSVGADCLSGVCSTFYEDKDGDGFAAASSGVRQVCGTASPGEQWLTEDLDCCDIAADPARAALVNPDYSGGPTPIAAEGCARPFDYDCNGQLSFSRPVAAGCNAFVTAQSCPTNIHKTTQTLVCGELVVHYACSWVNGFCQEVAGGQGPHACY